VVKYVLDKTSEMADVFEMYGVKEYMTALGLCVDPVFRGQGLGLEILKARFDLCKAVDLKVTMTVFTGVPSQLLAHRVGMEVIAEVWYEDCKEDGKPAFPNIEFKSSKAMAKRIE
jgi:GNAT superfamily N-acetyltransferase